MQEETRLDTSEYNTLLVRFFHVVEIVGTTCNAVLITSRLVRMTRDS